MSTSTSSPHWLFDLLRRRRDGEPTDAADLGTAFGLELTMIPDDEEPRAAPAGGGGGGGAARWWRRLTRRPAS